MKNEHFGSGAPVDLGAIADPGTPTGLATMLIGGAILVVGLGWLLSGLVMMAGRRTHSATTIEPRRNRIHGVFSKFEMWKPHRQVEVVAAADFEIVPLLNRSEARLLPVLEAAIRRYAPDHRVMAQTSMGEVLRPRSMDGRKDLRDAAYASINSKRFDFVIVDRAHRLVAAIEYQGSGHYHETSFLRDAVKREVCRKAGVAFIEVSKGMRPSEVTEALRRVLQPGVTASGLSRPPSATQGAGNVVPYPAARSTASD